MLVEVVSEQIVPTVSQVGQNRNVGVSLGDRSYEILISDAVLEQSGEQILAWLHRRLGAGVNPSACIVTDGNVKQYADMVSSSLAAQGFRVTSVEMVPGEQSKRLEVISAIWDRLIEFQADRRTVVVAVGGGVVGDAAGFAAASFARGIPFVQVPTTLLADVDSSVGGKVGINHPKAKNMIGAFHQPLGVLIDSRALSTLPDREYRAGLAEVVKYGVILDENFFIELEKNVDRINARDANAVNDAIARSCELKAQVVEEDEFERTGLRAILNYGHTFAHAFEALTGYGELLHGEAVAIGMLSASRLAERLGMIPSDVTQRQKILMQALQMPVSLPDPGKFSSQAVLERMQLDKKTVGGSLRFILPTRIGHVQLVKDVPAELVRSVLQEDGIE